MSYKDTIEELVSIILMQEEELKEINEKLERLNQYLDVYEEYIKGE